MFEQRWCSSSHNCDTPVQAQSTTKGTFWAHEELPCLTPMKRQINAVVSRCCGKSHGQTQQAAAVFAKAGTYHNLIGKVDRSVHVLQLQIAHHRLDGCRHWVLEAEYPVAGTHQPPTWHIAFLHLCIGAAAYNEVEHNCGPQLKQASPSTRTLARSAQRMCCTPVAH